MAKVYRILEGPILCCLVLVIIFMKKCTDCTDEATCAVNKLMTEVRDNTLKILENNTLADIAFKLNLCKIKEGLSLHYQ
jgi:DNA-binding IscR family transcriptional regulator